MSVCVCAFFLSVFVSLENDSRKKEKRKKEIHGIFIFHALELCKVDFD
uniref:Uncharacterized protein n=1 Tax=Rhizophora mucronata TaxID=61149 RepID=A0A2P2N5N3_RHIMU